MPPVPRRRPAGDAAKSASEIVHAPPPTAVYFKHLSEPDAKSTGAYVGGARLGAGASQTLLSPSTDTAGPEEQRLEMVLHNISHKDMILRLSNAGAEDVFARPKFSLFRPTSCLIKTQLDECATSGKQLRIATCPLTGRGVPDKGSGSTLQLPVGFDLSESPIPIPDVGSFRVRGKDSNALSLVNGGGHQPAGSSCITAVYFPLLSLLVPKWKESIVASGDYDCRKMIVLVSGVGTPRNPEHELEGNSTEVIAQMMQMFLKENHPDVLVILLHSHTNIFRYDENIRFVSRELLPLIEQERNAMARRHGESWRDMMHLTISFADGSPARISAINSSLRHYRPSFMHIWELKTFWHEGRICEEDIEVHTFEDMETTPPVPLCEVDPLAMRVIERMMELRDTLSSIYLSGVAHDLSSFWLRKTRKPVLAVLLIQKPGCPPEIFSGTNMEVSMPTGSLCAERNVIGSALADDLTLRRQDLKMVAVLGMVLDAAPGVSRGTTPAQSPRITPVKAADGALVPTLTSPEAFCATSAAGVPCKDGRRLRSESCADRMVTPPSGMGLPRSPSFDSSLTGDVGSPGRVRRGTREMLVRSLNTRSVANGESGRGLGRVVSKVRKAPTSLNPLKPCGACMEWLKKIAEVNPDFKVLTFTDYSCSGVYIESIGQLG